MSFRRPLLTLLRVRYKPKGGYNYVTCLFYYEQIDFTQMMTALFYILYSLYLITSINLRGHLNHLVQDINTGNQILVQRRTIAFDVYTLFDYYDDNNMFIVPGDTNCHTR